MIYYRDDTFCVSPGCEDACGRKLTPEVLAGAKAWWAGWWAGDEDGPPHDAPVAVSYFCGEPDDGRTLAEVARAAFAAAKAGA